MSAASEKMSISLEKLRENWQRQLVLHPNIPASVLKVALAIGWHLNRNKGGLAWPSVRTMSRLTSLSLSTVVWAVKWLETNGYVRVQRKRKGKRNLPNEYLPLLRKAALQPSSQRSAQREQRKTLIEQGVPIATSTEPSTEPLNEPHMQIRISASTDVDALPDSDHEGNKGSGIRERKGSEEVEKPTATPECPETARAECYRLAGDYDGNRGRALVTKALEEGVDDQEVLDEIRAAIEAGDDLGYALSSFWNHTWG